MGGCGGLGGVGGVGGGWGGWELGLGGFEPRLVHHWH